MRSLHYRSRRGLSLIELLLCLGILGVVLSSLLPSRIRSIRTPAIPLTPLAEWILWDLGRACRIFDPHPPGHGSVVGPRSRNLELAVPEGLIRYRFEARGLIREVEGEGLSPRSWEARGIRGSFQLRVKPLGGALIRVRLASTQDFLLTASAVDTTSLEQK